MRIILSVLVSVSSLLTANSAFATASAADSKCLDKAVVEDILGQFALNTTDVGNFDRCNKASKTYIIVETLALVKSLRFGNKVVPKPFNQDILPNDLWAYMTDKVQALSVGDSCPEGNAAYVEPGKRDGIMHFCSTFFTDALNVWDRAQFMIHETRHFEGYSHIDCTQGTREGFYQACDKSIEDKGSYAVTVEFLTKVAMNGLGISDEVRDQLKTMAVGYANQVFNELPTGKELTALYIVDDSGAAFLFSNDGLFSVQPLLNGKVFSRGASIAVFPNDKSSAYTPDLYNSKMSPLPVVGQYAQDYNKLAPADKVDVVDILTMGQLGAIITKTDFKGSVTAASDDAKFKLPWIAKSVFTGPEIGEQNKDSLYVVNEADQMFQVKLTDDAKYTLTPAKASVGGFKQLVVYQGQRLGLTAAGEVKVLKDGQWIPYEPLKGKHIQSMTRPVEWSAYYFSK